MLRMNNPIDLASERVKVENSVRRIAETDFGRDGVLLPISAKKNSDADPGNPTAHSDRSTPYRLPVLQGQRKGEREKKTFEELMIGECMASKLEHTLTKKSSFRSRRAFAKHGQ